MFKTGLYNIFTIAVPSPKIFLCKCVTVNLIFACFYRLGDDSKLLSVVIDSTSDFVDRA